MRWAGERRFAAVDVLCCRRHTFGPKKQRYGQGGFIMSAHDPRCRIEAPLLLVLALGIPCLVVGCGGGDSKPAPTSAEQGQKIQKYMSDYGQQIKAVNKAKAAVKKTPEASTGP
jgi:hypothetical protein